MAEWVVSVMYLREEEKRENKEGDEWNNEGGVKKEKKRKR